MSLNKPVAAPYVACRREETFERASMLTFYNGRLSWRDEHPRDRDHQGVLWGRRSHTPPDPETGQPRGTPMFAAMHAARQHEVMSGMWCQVCRRDRADRTADGWLFLVPRPEDDADGPLPANWPKGEPVVHPPVCLADAHQTLKRCPERRSLVAVRVRRPRLLGVLGDFYLPTPGGGAERAEPDEDGALVPYRLDGKPNPELPYVLASQLVRELHGCTPVDLSTASHDFPSRAAAKRTASPGRETPHNS